MDEVTKGLTPCELAFYRLVKLCAAPSGKWNFGRSFSDVDADGNTFIKLARELERRGLVKIKNDDTVLLRRECAVCLEEMWGKDKKYGACCSAECAEKFYD